jgi:hypothetical protein
VRSVSIASSLTTVLEKLFEVLVQEPSSARKVTVVEVFVSNPVLDGAPGAAE